MRVITKTFPKETEYVTLYPVGDVHYGAKECMVPEFKGYLRKIAEDPTAAVVLVGDLINNGIKSSVTNVYDEVCNPNQQVRDMISMLMPVRDKVIGAVCGNHEYRTIRDTSIDVMERIADGVGCADCYEPDAAFLKVSVGEKLKNHKPATYMIYLSHGAGGGALLGSGLSRQDAYSMSIEGVDISITGHTHKPTKTPSCRLVFDPYNNNIIQSNTLIFVCTSWLRYGGYSERKQMRPTAFYPQTIRLDGRKKEWT